MAGHSKWAQIKRKKGANDAARGRLFTKIIKEITVAAKLGGGDPDGNPRLRLAISNAKANNMPAENITRAIKKGTGELEGVNYEEITYEGYGPGGAAIIVESLTDNRNRTVAELRHIFAKHNGNLAESGAVSWIFERKGVIIVPKENYTEDQLFEIILEVEAENMTDEKDYYEITSSPENFEKVRKALESAGIKTEDASIRFVPRTTLKLEGKEAENTVKLINAIEENDDVQNVYTNADIDEKIMQEAE